MMGFRECFLFGISIQSKEEEATCLDRHCFFVLSDCDDTHQLLLRRPLPSTTLPYFLFFHHVFCQRWFLAARRVATPEATWKTCIDHRCQRFFYSIHQKTIGPDFFVLRRRCQKWIGSNSYDSHRQGCPETIRPNFIIDQLQGSPKAIHPNFIDVCQG